MKEPLLLYGGCVFQYTRTKPEVFYSMQWHFVEQEQTAGMQKAWVQVFLESACIYSVGWVVIDSACK